MRWAIRRLLWPAAFAGSLAVTLHAVSARWDYGRFYAGFIAAAVVGLTLLETAFPFRRDWRMTARSLGRDFKFAIASFGTVALGNLLFGWILLKSGGFRHGPLREAPLWAAVPVALLAYELLNYVQHRVSHRPRGRLGWFFWRTHAPHHLPEQLYGAMHLAAHPLNTLLVRGLVLLLPLHLLGLTPEAILLFNVIVTHQALFSHANLDIRAGWVNYLLVGTELHRFHHSTETDEAVNFGGVLPLWDQLFGTFRYRPGEAPAQVGVDTPSEYPRSDEFLKAMAYPFARSLPPPGGNA